MKRTSSQGKELQVKEESFKSSKKALSQERKLQVKEESFKSEDSSQEKEL